MTLDIKGEIGRRPLRGHRYRIWQHCPEHVVRLLWEAGFSLRGRDGDLEKAPIDAASKKQIIVCG
jgi:hypothetical protein